MYCVYNCFVFLNVVYPYIYIYNPESRMITHYEIPTKTGHFLRSQCGDLRPLLDICDLPFEAADGGLGHHQPWMG